MLFDQIEMSKSLLHHEILRRLSGTSTLCSIFRLIYFPCWFLLHLRFILRLVRRIRLIRYSSVTCSCFIGWFTYFSFFFKFEIIRVFDHRCTWRSEFIVSTGRTSFTLWRRIGRLRRTLAKTTIRLPRIRRWSAGRALFQFTCLCWALADVLRGEGFLFGRSVDSMCKSCLSWDFSSSCS